MKTTQRLLLILFTFSFMSTTCIKKDDLENSIFVDNKLEKSIYVVPNYHYPDTTTGFITKGILQANIRYQFRPLSKDYLRMYGICKEKNWKELIHSDTLLILVLDKNDVDNGNWDDYAKGNNYLKKYKLSYNDIISNGCQLIIE